LAAPSNAVWASASCPFQSTTAKNLGTVRLSCRSGRIKSIPPGFGRRLNLEVRQLTHSAGEHPIPAHVQDTSATLCQCSAYLHKRTLRDAACPPTSVHACGIIEPCFFYLCIYVRGTNALHIQHHVRRGRRAVNKRKCTVPLDVAPCYWLAGA
jgi:hypothetical protein